ncbi:hypothetical protein FHL15_000184 [Xylaria flabelliformis]|uniref:Uncharacterized protein n=1 Tax=Xylaria flabelliformis TaxID=2512241 RepID=A0A553IF62_9PEZI|nr:hypothetical protein FHL15_000184 [Xylaria flabelliformis]
MPNLGLAGLLLLLTACSCLAAAITSQTPDRRTLVETPCDVAEMYTWEWFLAHTKPMFKGPLNNKALFYSRDMSSAARAVAASQDKTTIWDLWPCKLYNHENVVSNPMRCIHHDSAQRQSFFGNMSLAFAKKARGGASVLHSFHYYWDPPRDGIWAAIEEPELTRHGTPVEWLRKFRMHPEFSQLAMNLISAAESAQRSQAQATWLKSRVGIEWLRNLRIEETITQWSEIFWRRPGAAPEPLHGKGHEEVKELKRREQNPLLNNGPTDEASTKCSNLNFFDDLVIW